MLALTILLSLVGAAVASLDINCTVIDTTDGTLRLAPSATGCQDAVSSDVCAYLFNRGITVQTLRPGMLETSRPVGCYRLPTVPSIYPNEDLKKIAIANCANYCGFCCMKKK